MGGYDNLPPPTQTDQDETREVLLYLEKVDPAAVVVPKQHAVMLQQNKEFHPDVLPVVLGQVVDFPNNDLIYHNVYSESVPNRFELPEYAGGKSVSVTFKHPGIVELFCGIHTTMNAYIVVLQNQFYAMPDASHTFSIANVPKGHYVLHAWHPRIDGIASKEIDVPDKGAVKVDFTL